MSNTPITAPAGASNNILIALQIIQLAETLAPTAVALFNSLKQSGQTVEQYISDAKAQNAAARDAANKQIAADQAELGKK